LMHFLPGVPVTNSGKEFLAQNYKIRMQACKLEQHATNTLLSRNHGMFVGTAVGKSHLVLSGELPKATENCHTLRNAGSP
jgi:hypothetical protein